MYVKIKIKPLQQPLAFKKIKAFVPFVLITPNHELWIKKTKNNTEKQKTMQHNDFFYDPFFIGAGI